MPNIEKQEYGIGVIRQDYDLMENETKTDYFDTASSIRDNKHHDSGSNTMAKEKA